MTILIQNLNKQYASGHKALNQINLEIQKGEIFALLGPNGAGKSTLINCICGIINPSSGNILVNGYDVIKEYKETRRMIGLVPQELTTDTFESVWSCVNFSRGLFGKPPNPQYLESLLKQLSLWDKKNEQLLALSGGMKRRVLIAKALSHDPKILFLDEPTAGVDVELRRDMWNMVRQLRENGVTIILTTHYIEEAEGMADRIGVINKGEIILVEGKQYLMKKLGKKEFHIQLRESISTIPDQLTAFHLELTAEGDELIYRYDGSEKQSKIANLLKTLDKAAIEFKDIHSVQSSLEDIFVNLVKSSTSNE